MRAVVVAHDKPEHLAIGTVPRPTPASSEALVAVAAFSLNRGEVRTARESASDGFRPGWDFAGTIIRAAEDGSTPPAGTRVVGLMTWGSWCEEIAVQAAAFAPVPDGMTLEHAAALPVAGLTALHAIRHKPSPRNVLVTGASGGVGLMATQLAKRAGAAITAFVRNNDREPIVRKAGACNVVRDFPAARAFGPFDLIVESLGSDVLAAALGTLAPGGVCVVVGATLGSVSTFDAAAFRVGGTSVYGLVLGYELGIEPPSVGLKELIELAAAGEIAPMVEVRASWETIGRVADDLIARRFAGKAVLLVAPEPERVCVS
jgi:NADPH2:quinone reductase